MGRGTEERGRLKIVDAGIATEACDTAFYLPLFSSQESVLKRVWPQQSRDLAVS